MAAHTCAEGPHHQLPRCQQEFKTVPTRVQAGLYPSPAGPGRVRPAEVGRRMAPAHARAAVRVVCAPARGLVRLVCMHIQLARGPVRCDPNGYDHPHNPRSNYSPGYFKTSYRPRAQGGIGAWADSDTDLQAHSLGGSAAKVHIRSCLIRTRPRSP